ncbi:alpha/beta hydrolase [Sporolactobacillus kofuensis]|uniref:Alpha/beta hydrolase n=1 Tax=Sporolactobacillus kofuensis TaxID=269672 RepID=A0ABW1WJP1_9BACL|nr:alpha/beta hydrolase [Sporolactobacillus kofuensis]MCO7176556.1 alpha/beta hydrolase [Sporolactobacillus kofuensis]
MAYHYLFNEGKSERAPIFILLHGTGGDEYSLLPLMQMIAPDAAVLSLRGNRVENGMNRFFNRFPDGRIDVEDMVEETEHLHQFLTSFGERHGFHERKVIAMGYSNGANMIVSTLYHVNPVFHGALLFRGTDYRPMDHFPKLKGVSIFISAGSNDPLVPKESTVKMIHKFKESQATVRDHWTVSGHQLIESEIHAAQKWFESLNNEKYFK